MTATFNVSALEQDVEWTTADGETLRLENMKSSHRRNLLSFLNRRKVSLRIKQFLLYFGGDEPTADGAWFRHQREMNEFIEEDVDVWFARQPLVRRLRELVDADNARERRLTLNQVRDSRPQGRIGLVGGALRLRDKN